MGYPSYKEPLWRRASGPGAWNPMDFELDDDEPETAAEPEPEYDDGIEEDE